MVVVVVGLVLVLPRGSTASAANAAVLAVLRGDVDAQKGSAGTFEPALDGDLLRTGDLVRADGQGRAVLTFFEGSTLSLEPGSQVRVTSLERLAGDGISVTIEQTIGRTWAAISKLRTPDSRFEVRTPSATAVVRGTAFETTVEIVNGQPVTTIRTGEGEVLVTAQGGGQTPVPAGREVRVTQNAPAPPASTSAPAPRLVLQGTPGLGFVVTDPRGLQCGSAGNAVTRQLPRCDVQGTTVVIGDVVAGSYAVTLTAAASLPQASLAVQGSGSPLQRAMNAGDLVRTSFPVALAAGGTVSAGPFAPAEVVATLCGADVRGRVFSSGRLDERNGALRAYSQSERGQPAALILSQQELTAAAGDGLRQVSGAASVSNLAVTVDPAGLHLSGEAAAGPLTVPVRGDVIAGASGGKLILRLRELDLGPLPGAVRDPLRNAVDRSLTEFATQLPLVVERVSFRQGCLAVIGTTPR